MLLEIWKCMLIPIIDRYINTPHKSALRTSLGREEAEQKGQTENFSFSNTLIIVLCIVVPIGSLYLFISLFSLISNTLCLYCSSVLIMSVIIFP
jgi:hypothetical protein